MKRLLTIVLIISAFCITLSANAASDAASSDAETVLQTAADNLIVNWDFSKMYEGTLKPVLWTYEGYVTEASEIEVEAEPTTLNPCLHIHSSEKNDARVVQDVYTGKDSYVRLSCDIRTSENAKACISVTGFYDAQSEFVTSSEWTHVELFCYTSNSETIKVALRLGYYGDENLCAGDAWFDNVTAEKTEKQAVSYVDLTTAEKQVGNNAGSTNQNVISESGEMPRLPEMIIALIAVVLEGVCIYILLLRKKKEHTFSNRSDEYVALALLLVAGFVVRIVCNYLFTSLKGNYGHSTDIGCFVAWGWKVFAEGPSKFYSEGYFADYPPGYMWILGACEAVCRLFGANSGAGQALIYKMPSILCDIFAAFLVYAVAIQSGRKPRSGLLFAALIAFNPVIIFISSVWGQIDIIQAVFTACAFLFAYYGTEKESLPYMAASGALYGLAVALKPQALMFGPLYAVIFIMSFITAIVRKKKAWIPLAGTALAAACAFAVILIPAIPFKGTQQGLWLVEKYAGTAGSYNYASVEAYNFFALCGANWTNADNAFIGAITYKQFGTVCICIVVAASIALYVIGKKKNSGLIFLSAAFLVSGIFVFGHFMHERYLFPALLLIGLATVLYNDLRLYIAYFAFTVSTLYNTMGAFLILDCRLLEINVSSYQTFVTVGAVLTLIAFAFFAYAVFAVVFSKHDESEDSKHKDFFKIYKTN